MNKYHPYNHPWQNRTESKNSGHPTKESLEEAIFFAQSKVQGLPDKHYYQDAHMRQEGKRWNFEADNHDKAHMHLLPLATVKA